VRELHDLLRLDVDFEDVRADGHEAVGAGLLDIVEA
jgi:hypothetical protein